MPATVSVHRLYEIILPLITGTEPSALDSKDATSGTQYPIPSSTVLFLRPEHLKVVTTDVIKQGARSWLLYPFAWRHKISGVSEGFVTKESLWDRVLFDGARSKVLGPTAATLRAVIVSGGMCCFSPYMVIVGSQTAYFFSPQVQLKHH